MSIDTLYPRNPRFRPFLHTVQYMTQRSTTNHRDFSPYPFRLPFEPCRSMIEMQLTIKCLSPDLDESTPFIFSQLQRQSGISTFLRFFVLLFFCLSHDLPHFSIIFPLLLSFLLFQLTFFDYFILFAHPSYKKGRVCRIRMQVLLHPESTPHFD